MGKKKKEKKKKKKPQELIRHPVVQLIAQPEPEPQHSAMEVHKHPHHVTSKKKWGEYLLEFSMLFFAVFLGFIAENKREHVAEHKRANALTTALIRDFSKDTMELNRLSAFETLQIKRLDSLIMFLSVPSNQVPQQDFYRLVRQAQISFVFAQADATINQLKNAGYLRYFSKDSLSTLLSEYDFFIRDIQGSDQIITTLIYDKYYDLIVKILDPELMRLQFSNKWLVPESIGISRITPDELKHLQNLLTMIRRLRDNYLETYIEVKNKATQIINYLKN